MIVFFFKWEKFVNWSFSFHNKSFHFFLLWLLFIFCFWLFPWQILIFWLGFCLFFRFFSWGFSFLFLFGWLICFNLNGFLNFSLSYWLLPGGTALWRNLDSFLLLFFYSFYCDFFSIILDLFSHFNRSLLFFSFGAYRLSFLFFLLFLLSFHDLSFSWLLSFLLLSDLFGCLLS